MGWGVCLIYFELARVLSHRALMPLLVGGAFYTTGAVVFVLGRPVLWPGVFESHELFHFLVLAGSASHYWFVLTVVVPLDPATLAPAATTMSRELLIQDEGSIFRLDPRSIHDPRPHSAPTREAVRTTRTGQAA
jgi:hypothetical protein